MNERLKKCKKGKKNERADRLEKEENKSQPYLHNKTKILKFKKKHHGQ